MQNFLESITNCQKDNGIKKTTLGKSVCNKAPNEVSWTQELPKTSLDVVYSLNLKKNSRIIDVGGGDSNLIDFLLN
jgi:hypothetical protein